MTIEEQIKALCYSSEVPDHTKRHFSADCAERSMFAWCERTGEEPLPEWWDLMEAIRNFAEGRITMKDLQEIRQVYLLADLAADLEADRVAYWAADWVADWAADRAAYLSADWVADSTTDRDTEREWQLQHFHALIAQHDALTSRLLGLFNRRAAEITHALPQALKQYEEALFI